MLLRENREMEEARRASGLEGLRFLYYNCPKCGHDNLFLEVAPVAGESNHEFRVRKKKLARVVHQLSVVSSTILVVEQGVWQG